MEKLERYPFVAMPENPCLKCAACCAHFRVSFHWSESDPEQGGSVPQEFTESVTPFRVCMRGTNQGQPRCIALDGAVGSAVLCRIYALRSSTCREFAIQWSAGWLYYDPGDLERCTAARAAWGLAPLELQPHLVGASQSPALPAAAISAQAQPQTW